LARLEFAEISRAEYCSYSDDSYYFSYRRNALTGRMASLIWIDSSA